MVISTSVVLLTIALWFCVSSCGDDYLRHVAIHSKLQKQVDYSNSPEAVSSDFVGSRAAGIVDGLATIATGNNSCVVYVWYDNEYGYSCQVIRCLRQMTKATLPAYPIAS